MEDTQAQLITNGVPVHEQTLKSGKPFWVFMVANLCIATWLMGVFVAGMRLNLTQGIWVLFFGSLAGSIVPALTSIIGPQSRLSQIESGRWAFGILGKRLPAFLQWVNCIGWDAVNNIISATALVMLGSGFGIKMPFWLALAGLVAVQILFGVYGHHLIQNSSRFTGALLAVTFIAVGIISLYKSNISITPTSADTKIVFSALSLMFMYNTGSWSTYTADYTRYLPKETPKRIVFIQIFLGLFLSLFVLSMFGFLTASAVTEQSPMGVMKALQNLTGSFSPLVLLLITFAAIPANAVNDNSAAYSLISCGFKFSRPTAAVLGAIVGYLICLVATDSFMEIFENFLLMFGHWILPWASILLVDWFVVKNQTKLAAPRITVHFIIFLGVALLSVILFTANPLYTGPVAAKLGGIDIGPYIGFVVAGLLSLLSSKSVKVRLR
jgi:NCS1 family nucleobase:cation symporter-1